MIYPKFDILDFNKAEIVNREDDEVCVEFSRGNLSISAWVKCDVQLDYDEDHYSGREYRFKTLIIADNAIWTLTNDVSDGLDHLQEDMQFIFNDHIAHLNDVLHDIGEVA